MNSCDKCYSKIIKGKCSCGEWFEKENTPNEATAFEKAILEFNKMRLEILSADHHSGTCIIFFKGNYEDCEMIKKFIQEYLGFKE